MVLPVTSEQHLHECSDLTLRQHQLLLSLPNSIDMALTLLQQQSPTHGHTHTRTFQSDQQLSPDLGTRQQTCPYIACKQALNEQYAGMRDEWVASRW